MQIKKILLVGNYNAGNVGDDLLRESSLKGLREFFPEAEVKVMCHKGDAPLPPAGIKSWLSFNLFKARKAIKETDLVVFGGGGLFNAEVPYSIYIWAKPLKLAQRFDKPVVMLGQSFADRVSYSVGRLMEKADLITVRDSVSERMLQRMEILTPYKLTTDLIFNLDINDLPNKKIEFEHDKFIALNLRPYKHISDEFTLEVAEKIISKILKNTSLAVYLLPFSKEDIELLKLVRESFADTGRVILPKFDSEILLDIIRQSEGVISERLHPLLCSVILEKQVMALSYSSKVNGLMKDLALEEFCIDLRQMNVDEQILNVTLDSFLENCEAGVKYSSQLLEDLNRKAKSNFKLLRSFVDNI